MSIRIVVYVVCASCVCVLCGEWCPRTIIPCENVEITRNNRALPISIYNPYLHGLCVTAKPMNKYLHTDIFRRHHRHHSHTRAPLWNMQFTLCIYLYIVVGIVLCFCIRICMNACVCVYCFCSFGLFSSYFGQFTVHVLNKLRSHSDCHSFRILRL